MRKVGCAKTWGERSGKALGFDVIDGRSIFARASVLLHCQWFCILKLVTLKHEPCFQESPLKGGLSALLLRSIAPSRTLLSTHACRIKLFLFFLRLAATVFHQLLSSFCGDRISNKPPISVRHGGIIREITIIAFQVGARRAFSWSRGSSLDSGLILASAALHVKGAPNRHFARCFCDQQEGSFVELSALCFWVSLTWPGCPWYGIESCGGAVICQGLA